LTHAPGKPKPRKIGAKRNDDDGQEPDHDLRPEE
jgi:hypothetical protein